MEGVKAIALTRYLPITDPQALVDVELPKPVATGRDLLVRVEAISVNPVDTKVRAPKPTVENSPRVLGWDAAGVVESVGSEVTKFKPGDAVYYAGDITRAGCNSEFQLVDERIVGKKPATLSFAEAAALPLTAITAWEALMELPGFQQPGKSLLIIGGAGGVGSIAIQLAKLSGLTVIATASRPETRDWVVSLGADHVVDHRQPLGPQLIAIGHAQVDFIANFNQTDAYWDVMAEVIRPFGHMVCIVENTRPMELGLLKSKSVSFHWEFMFTRAMYQTPDMGEQGALLDAVAERVDAGQLRTTLTHTLAPINATHLITAHAQLESGKTIGKWVLEGWRK
jgi:zinc-binding alcohol dehydrogenase family protein